MTAKAYYLTTLGAWRRHAGRLANSHWLVLDSTPRVAEADAAGAAAIRTPVGAPGVDARNAGSKGTERVVPTNEKFGVLDDTTPIFALIEADEGAHLALQDDAEFAQLPHPLAPKPISEAAQKALAAHGVVVGATMFEAAETLAGAHPLLRHRVF